MSTPSLLDVMIREAPAWLGVGYIIMFAYCLGWFMCEEATANPKNPRVSLVMISSIFWPISFVIVIRQIFREPKGLK